MTMDPMERWIELERTPPPSVVVAGVDVGRGSRVRLRPRIRGDVVDGALDGRLATVESIEQDLDDNIMVAVTVLDDPGRDMGDARMPGHRFFFSVDEIEPVAVPGDDPLSAPRILVAGIGNMFLGDDGFGCEVANELARHAMPAGVDVVDFGIRGIDLAYALQSDYDAVIMVDATPRGEAAGTVYVLEVDAGDAPHATLDTHGMDPVKVLASARSLGRVPQRVFVVGCEPAVVPTGEGYDDMLMGLSEPVQGAVDTAIDAVQSLIQDLTERSET